MIACAAAKMLPSTSNSPGANTTVRCSPARCTSELVNLTRRRREFATMRVETNRGERTNEGNEGEANQYSERLGSLLDLACCVEQLTLCKTFQLVQRLGRDH